MVSSSSSAAALLWLLGTTSMVVTMAQDCSTFQEQMEFAPGIMFDYTVVESDGLSLRGKVTYSHDAGAGGYVAIGFPQPSGGMVGAKAILGLLDQDVQMWDLNSYAENDVVPSPDEDLQDLLVEASFVQSDTESVLNFEVDMGDALNLVADGETPSSLIWAVGGSNVLAYHANRDIAAVTLNVCVEEAQEEEQEQEEDGGEEEEDDGGEEEEGPEDSDAVDCDALPQQVEFAEGLMLNYAVVDDEDSGDLVLKGRVTYSHAAGAGGYVGIGFPQPGGGMIGAKAILGLLDQEVQMWDLNSYAVTDVVPSPDEDLQSLLQEGSFAQSDTESVLDFQVALDDDTLNLVADGETESSFIWAVGGSNVLARHANRGVTAVTLDVCISSTDDDDNEEDDNEEDDTEAPATSGPTVAPTTATPTATPTEEPTVESQQEEEEETPEPTGSPVAETVEATPEPTSSPIAAVVSESPVADQQNEDDDCSPDDANQPVTFWVIVMGERENCAWLADQDEEVRAFHCENFGRVERACRVTCEACRPRDGDECADDEDAEFRIFAPSAQTCGWLAGRNREERKQKLCQRNVQAQEACPTTCNPECA